MYDSWKNYLPSKKVVGIIIAIIAAGGIWYGASAWKSYQANQAAVAQQTKSAPIIIAAGNPVNRDSDSDGVMDWQEIAADLDPLKGETTPGIPDQAAYQAKSETVAAADLAAFNETGDTDRISYTIFDQLVRSANTTASLDDAAVQQAAEQEIAKYFTALAPTKRYDVATIPSIPSTQASELAYKTSITKAGSVDLFGATFQNQLNTYMETGANKSAIDSKIASIRALLPKITIIPVPAAIRSEQVEVFNALDGFATILETYNPKNTDPLYQLANQTLLKMYEWAMITNSATILKHYNNPIGTVIENAIKTSSSL